MADIALMKHCNGILVEIIGGEFQEEEVVNMDVFVEGGHDLRVS